MRKAFLVAGLGWGDEGKGATTEYLVRKYKADLVVRYNGGAQAAHNVVENLPDSKGRRHHTFAQFGSGSLQPGVRTHLSRFVLVNPLNMMLEAQHLDEKGIHDIWDRTTVEESALIITPFQIALNRLSETSRLPDDKHGSCGAGIGQTRSDYEEYGDKVLFAKDLQNKDLTREKLEFLRRSCLAKADSLNWHQQASAVTVHKEYALLVSDSIVDWLIEQYSLWPAKVVPTSHLATLMKTNLVGEESVTVFEGSQGVLLDETFGVAPHNTYTDTTYNNALTLLRENSYWGITKKVGCIRAYMTRHGAGPLRTEDPDLLEWMPERHNGKGDWQGHFRVGHFDAPAVNYAIDCCNGVDVIALSHVDMWRPELTVLTTSAPKIYYAATSKLEYVKLLWNMLSAKIGIVGKGPCFEDRMEIDNVLEMDSKEEKV